MVKTDRDRGGFAPYPYEETSTLADPIAESRGASVGSMLATGFWIIAGFAALIWILVR